MRNSILAIVVAIGSTAGLPALAQQSTESSSQQQMQDE
jgi:hypothetical protein